MLMELNGWEEGRKDVYALLGPAQPGSSEPSHVLASPSPSHDQAQPSRRPGQAQPSRPGSARSAPAMCPARPPA